MRWFEFLIQKSLFRGIFTRVFSDFYFLQRNPILTGL